MTDFEYDVMLKKRIANQAKHRKCGSKSKKCPMSTDYMTRRQWEKRCGEVMTYQLREPMTWKDFRSQPIHIQKLYIEDIMNAYNVTATDLAKMFGVTPATVLRCCKEEGLQINFTKGKRMSDEQRESFEQFLRGELNNENSNNIEAQPTEADDCDQMGKIADEGRLQLDINKGRYADDMAMTAFSLCFSGKFNRDMLYNSIATILPAGANVTIEIRCTMQTECG